MQNDRRKYPAARRLDQRPLSGVKRTSAEPREMSACDLKADIVPSLNEADLSRYDTFATGGRHEAARVHQAACRRGRDAAVQ